MSCHNNLRNYMLIYLCRPAARIFRQRVEATIALQGTPGLLVGLGAFLAGAALAAFLVAAIPVLLVSTSTSCKAFASSTPPIF